MDDSAYVYVSDLSVWSWSTHTQLRRNMGLLYPVFKLLVLQQFHDSPKAPAAAAFPFENLHTFSTF